MKFLRKTELKEGVSYIRISSDFILDLYERTKKLKGEERDIVVEQVKTFAKHLEEYIERPTKLSYNKKNK